MISLNIKPGHKSVRAYYEAISNLSELGVSRTAFNNWLNMLEEGLRFSLEQMRGSKVYGSLCYQPSFPPEVRSRFSVITKRLFEHPLWVQETIQDEIAETNQDVVVTNIFRREGLDYIYITKL